MDSSEYNRKIEYDKKESKRWKKSNHPKRKKCGCGRKIIVGPHFKPASEYWCGTCRAIGPEESKKEFMNLQMNRMELK